MTNILIHPNQKLALLQKDLEAKIHQLDNPTQKSVDNLLMEEQIDAVNLISLSGYYVMDKANRKAFLSINTVNYKFEVNVKGKTFSIKVPVVSVSYSMNGETSKEYSFDELKFNRDNLTIENVMDLNFSRNYEIGKLVTFSGNVYNQGEKVFVSGNTYFNPVPLKTFAGNYHEMSSLAINKKVLSITESKIFFDFGDGLTEITEYSYTPSMYAVEFYDPQTNEKYVLMLGTPGKMGLACSILNGDGTRFAVSIP